MAYDPTADVAAVFADGFDTVAVTKGATTVQGYTNQGGIAPTDGLGLEVQQVRTIVTIQTGALGTLKYDDVISVAGNAGRMRETWPIDDGKLTQFVWAQT